MSARLLLALCRNRDIDLHSLNLPKRHTYACTACHSIHTITIAWRREPEGKSSTLQVHRSKVVAFRVSWQGWGPAVATSERTSYATCACDKADQQESQHVDESAKLFEELAA